MLTLSSSVSLAYPQLLLRELKTTLMALCRKIIEGIFYSVAEKREEIKGRKKREKKNGKIKKEEKTRSYA